MPENHPSPPLPLWVFAYGSLVWNPGFDPAEQVLATLPGFARTFCMKSIHHRGTVATPGLVLALDPDPLAACDGIAFRVGDADANAVLTELRERELVSSAYLEEFHDVQLNDGRSVRAVAYVVDTEHEQYCGGLDLETQANIIAMAVGGRGPNPEYLWNTEQGLTDIGIEDADLMWLSSRVRQLAS